MRSLKISLILFVVLIICITANIFYIHRCANILTDIAEIPAEVFNENDLRRLEEFWGKSHEFIGASISETNLDYISRLIVSVTHAYNSGDVDQLSHQLLLLQNAAQDLSRYEKISIANLL